ncbi:unnamed protein product, partial [Closterium sp. NIES-54]
MTRFLKGPTVKSSISCPNRTPRRVDFPALPARACHANATHALPCPASAAVLPCPTRCPALLASACPALCQRPTPALVLPCTTRCPALPASACLALCQRPAPALVLPCTTRCPHPARCAALQPARCPALQRARCPARAPAARALPAAVPAHCAACVRLACGARRTVGHPLGFDSWLEGLHLYLHSVTRDDVSLFEHTSGSLQPPKAPAEPAVDAGEEVRKQFRAAHIAYKRWMARDAAATLAVRLHLSFDQRANFRQVPSAHALYSAV